MAGSPIQVSPKYSYEPSNPSVIRDICSDRDLDKSDFETKVNVYEDRIKGWFFKSAHLLENKDGTEYAILQIATAQIEGMEQYRKGRTSEGNKSSVFFVYGMKRIFNLGVAKEAGIYDFYRCVRCGLFHDGFTKRRVFVSDSYEDAVTIEGEVIKVNPRKYLSCIEADFTKYIEDLRNDKKEELRRHFGKLWDEAWKKAKEGGSRDAQI